MKGSTDTFYISQSRLLASEQTSLTNSQEGIMEILQTQLRIVTSLKKWIIVQIAARHAGGRCATHAFFVLGFDPSSVGSSALPLSE